MEKTIETISDLIRSNQRFFICAHENPEGDAIGATLGLGLALASAGKEVVVYNPDGIPSNLQFLPKQDTVVHRLPEPFDFEVILVLDCGELERVGTAATRLAGHPRLVNIDHHQTNSRFGVVNWVDPQTSSTGEMIFQLLENLDVPVRSDAALCLFTAIYTDTMALSTPSASPETFRVCGELVRIGIDTRQVSVEYYFKQSERRVRLLARALSSLRIENGGRIAGITLTASDLKATGATPDDLEGFVEFPRNIEGVDVAYLLREQDGKTKGSLRSSTAVDVAAVAESLGGGGHARAAGFRTQGALEDVRAQLIQKLVDALL